MNFPVDGLAYVDRSACPSRAKRWWLLAVVQVVVLSVVGIWLATTWQPAPHSDWLYYWKAAGHADLYRRGGFGLWLLAIPKLMGLPPVACALALNLPATAAILALAYRSDQTRWKVFAQMVAAYLLLITPYFGIVQLDQLAAACVAAAFWLLLDPAIRMSAALRVCAAIVALTVGVSTKPQYALVLWTLCGLLVASWAVIRVARRTRRAALVLAGVLVLGACTGFAADVGLRRLGGHSESMRTSSAVTLYGGLLVSSTGQRCGYWSVEAAQAAKADMGRPLADAVLGRLAAQPLSHWAAVVACKWPQVMRPPPYALYWLIESPNVRTRIDAGPQRSAIESTYQRALRVERRLYRWLTLLIMLACVFTVVRLRSGLSHRVALPILWIGSFWAVHAVFEIQGRYFLGMFLLAPILCALAFRWNRFAHSSTSHCGTPEVE